MAGSPYASALGRFKALQPTLLPADAFPPLVRAKDLSEILKLLEPTAYGPEIAQAGATYQGAAAVEVAVNRLFVHRQLLLLESASFAGKPLIEAYLRRWDIENIGLVLSAKSEGRSVSESETFLVSSREIPAGLFAGAMGLDDFRTLLALPNIEAVATGLVRFGYGGVLLPLLDDYSKTRDIFPLLAALQRQYYERVLDAAKFFQGDEWVIREFLRSEIDLKNVLLLLKGKAASLPVEVVLERFLDGGELTRDRVADLYNVRDVPELVAQLEGRFPALKDGLERYGAEKSLVPFEIALTRERTVRELKRLRSFPLSISILFTFLTLAELERADLRKIIYGKLYGIAPDELERSLVLPRA
ncbi:MAG: V-type ATPase subunit [Thermoplasmata archaeon]|nr:V-type ATPase subunit [Thermoplasmata archaeon]